MKSRSNGIDLLRVIGLICIILAHVDPPELIWQVRSFDVVMMVCISTISFTEYSTSQPYFQYIKKRIKRLLFPTWEYILLVGIIFYIITALTGLPNPYPLKSILIGLVTFHGIGYLWIIRVFLYNALINPFIRTAANNKWWWGGLIIGCICYGVLKYIILSYGSPSTQKVAEATILDFIAYGAIAVLSYKLYHLSDKKLLISVAITACCVVAISVYNHEFNPNAYKYPPGSLYILWGLFVVGISYYVLRKIQIKKLPKPIQFISANSLWIYFWHALILLLEQNYYNIGNWLLNWLLLITISTSICYVQNIIVGVFCHKRNIMQHGK